MKALQKAQLATRANARSSLGLRWIAIVRRASGLQGLLQKRTISILGGARRSKAEQGLESNALAASNKGPEVHTAAAQSEVWSRQFQHLSRLPCAQGDTCRCWAKSFPRFENGKKLTAWSWWPLAPRTAVSAPLSGFKCHAISKRRSLADPLSLCVALAVQLTTSLQPLLALSFSQAFCEAQTAIPG